MLSYVTPMTVYRQGSERTRSTKAHMYIIEHTDTYTNFGAQCYIGLSLSESQKIPIPTQPSLHLYLPA